MSTIASRLVIRPRRRVVAAATTVCAAATLAVGLALRTGALSVDTAGRILVAVFGATGLLVLVAVLPPGSFETHHRGRRLPLPSRWRAPRPEAPLEGPFETTARAIRLSASTAGDYEVLLRPRLVALAEGRLVEQHVDLSDHVTVERLLGPRAIEMIGVRQRAHGSRPRDHHGPGVPPVEVLELLTRLTELA
jgi:hypothetical protein